MVTQQFQDPATLLQSQIEKLPRSSYFTTSRIKSEQAIVVLCSGTEDDTNSFAGDIGSANLDAVDPAQKMHSWSEVSLVSREKLVEDQLKHVHVEYCRLFDLHGEKVEKGAKGSADKEKPCRSCTDPTSECLRTVILHTRHLTKERIVFHYIHHRAPSAPALHDEGKLLLYTEDSNDYKALPLEFVHDELGVPAIYIFDCPHAGRLVRSLDDLLKEDDDVVALGTCEQDDILPWDRLGLPVDFFTACLTSPIKAALNFYRTRGAAVLSEPLLHALPLVTGSAKNRNTPLGELTSIYTAVTDAIAWSSFEPPIFRRIFREDPALAELFRNFLLAQRILYTFGLRVSSRPSLIPTHGHHLWDVWDTALELFLVRLVRGSAALPLPRPHAFFDEQMEAFWVWLRFHPLLGGQGLVPHPLPEVPVELPIVLQGLLHQSSRLEALRLLANFADMGVGAVHFTLLVGARPYLTNLLRTPDAAPLALIVWTKMITFDSTGKEGMVSKAMYKHFLKLASSESMSSHHRAFACLCLTVACHIHPESRVGCFKEEFLDKAITLLEKSKQLLPRWMTALACSQLVRDCPQAADAALKGRLGELLLDLLEDPAPEIRASAVCALGSILTASTRTASVLQTSEAAAAGLEPLVPLFRRFLGLQSTSPSAAPANAESTSLDSSPNGVASRRRSISKAMLERCCHATAKGTGMGDDTDNASIPICGILVETSMLVRYELLCALTPWVGELSTHQAARFASFDALPAPPWGAGAAGETNSVTPPPSPTIRAAPSCPSLSAIERSNGTDEVSDGLFKSESIMYGWTISCLQQPNGLSHAVEHDLALSCAT